MQRTTKRTGTMLAAAVLLAGATLAGGSGSGGGSDDAKQRAVVDEIEDVDGHVEEIESLGWALVPEGDEGTRYMPENLPEEHRQDGRAVTFSGEVLEIRPGERLWGTPLRLTEIEAREDDA